MAAGGRRSGGRIIILLALVLIVGLAAVIFLFKDQLLPKAPAAQAPTQAPQEKMVDIVITTQFIKRGTQIDAGVLTTVPYPEKDLVEGTFYTSMDNVVGKQAKYDLEARVPLTSSLIVDKPVGSEAAFQIPKGLVAVSIPINRLTSVSYAPQPGDHVNIIVSLMLTDVDPNFQSRLPNLTSVIIAPGPRGENVPPSLTIENNPSGAQQGRVELDGNLNQAVYVYPSEIQRPRPVSQTLVQDAIVLFVGDYKTAEEQQAAPTATPTPDPNQQQPQQTATVEPNVPKEITLVVSPQDAVTLNYLMLVGANLNLALRATGDGDKVKTEAVTLQFLMDQYAIPNPAKLPYAIEPRVDKLVLPTPAPNPTTQPNP